MRQKRRPGLHTNAGHAWASKTVGFDSGPLFRQTHEQMDFRLYTRCPIKAPVEAVTSIRPDTEIDPGEVGADADELNAAWHAITRLYASGMHPAISLCVRRRGKTLFDRAIGHVSGTLPDDPADAPLVPVSFDTPFCLASASKPITAMLIHKLVERELLGLDDRVADHLPDFGQHGKETITIRHLLTHRAGLAITPKSTMDLELLAQPDKILELLYAETPAWTPGRHMGYHALTSGFLFAALIQSVTGKTIDQVLDEEIRQPMATRWLRYGAAREDHGLVARNAFTGAPVPPPFSLLVERALGLDVPGAVRLMNDPRFLSTAVPSANIVATAEETVRFFEVLRNGGYAGRTQIFKRETIREAVANQSGMEPDATLLLPFRYGMGFMLGGEYASLFGLRARHAFGHIGLTNTLCWADPDRDLSVALLTSGKPVLYPEFVSFAEAVFRIAGACPRDSASASDSNLSPN
ncbi:MAG TPA: hydrolase [Deltaproteobacteria bacterium]|nr:hydrolase [Deltaproteobacteria bacterium]